jgi:myo-inositol-1(or 4)-monophosphatase
MTEEEVAVQATLAAARTLRERPATGVRHKGRVDLVTEVDLACERAIREVLAHHTPDLPVLGEEGGGGHAPTRWVVDPIDGTTNFVHGLPHYAVSIGLEVDGVATVGVVLDVGRDELYRATRGRGATCNGAPLRTSDVRDLGEALLGTGFPYDRAERPDFYLAFVREALLRTQGIRRAGAAALDLCWVARGALDGFWEFGLKPWDRCAGSVLVEEAGGRFTWDRDLTLATNAWLHDALAEMTAAPVG